MQVRIPAMTISVSQNKDVQFGWMIGEVDGAEANRTVYLTKKGKKLHKYTDCLGERDVVETLTYAEALERNCQRCRICYPPYSSPKVTILRTETFPDYRPS
jgi:hypothetical protein